VRIFCIIKVTEQFLGVKTAVKSYAQCVLNFPKFLRCCCSANKSTVNFAWVQNRLIRADYVGRWGGRIHC